jgi:predicted transposase YdaD
MQPQQPPPGKPEFDQPLKHLVTRAPNGFVALIAPGRIWRADRSPELPATRRQADLVWEVERPDGRRGILHIELQTKVERNLGERLAEYLVRLYRRDHLPIRSILVLLRETAHVPTSPFVIPSEDEDEDSLICRFTVIRLWELPQEQILGTEHYALWPLVSLMANVTAESTRLVAERIAALPIPREERQELTGLLAVLAGTRLPITTILEALRRSHMLEDLLRESSVAEWLRAEGRAEGEAKGRAEGEAKGKAEGEAKGKAEGMRQMARVALEGRFAPLTADVLAALQTADEATLRDVVAHVASDSLEQMRARLGLG